MVASKTNVTGRVKSVQKTHFCPEPHCDLPSKMVQHRPGKAMFGHCMKGHVFPKKELVLR